MKPRCALGIAASTTLLGADLFFVACNFSNIMEWNVSGDQRVARARIRVGTQLKEEIKGLSISYPPSRIFIRAFKHERELEVWVSNSKNSAMQLFKSYSVAGASGTLGPKRKEGDRQVPEGVYEVDRFNPKSRFHLSLGLNYPNAIDLDRSGKENPGGDIFIHGDYRSIGCLAMTDEKIDEIYLLALDSHSKHGQPIEVHIFPFRMTPKKFAEMKDSFSYHEEFWATLQPIYAAFEKTKRVPKVSITKNGYRLADMK